jgi:mevalonate kinase
VKSARISIAGKTFLAGEYLALRGGPAFVIATDPRFQLEIVEKKSTLNPFHKDSPGGRFYNEHIDFFSKFALSFQDPYKGLGGFCASSAQFALLHALKQLGDQIYTESERFIDWHEMLSDYQKLSLNETIPPSGADVVGAVSGAITWFDRAHGKVQTFSWPFQEYEFALYHTGEKLKTHEHLKSLTDFSDQLMAQAVDQIHSGFKNVDFETFLQGLEKFQDELVAQKLVAEKTKKHLFSLKKDADILFAKGCGALGSDVLFVLMQKGKASPSELVGLKKIASSQNISLGIKVHL